MTKTTRTPSQTPELSIVVPLGPRHEDLGEICRTLRRVFASRSYEVIFVDDATGLKTRQELQAVIRQRGEPKQFGNRKAAKISGPDDLALDREMSHRIAHKEYFLWVLVVQTLGWPNFEFRDLRAPTLRMRADYI